MDLISGLISFILHIDTHLGELIAAYGALVHAMLFGIIFIETGVVAMPFLPGDSLLFAAGAFAQKGLLELWYLLPALIVAAVAGDTLNYWIGALLGQKVFTENNRFFKKEYLIRTQHFYERYGKKAIFLGRFVPIVRTFVPFVAGIGKMPYRTFAAYNILGGVVWVTLFLAAGYYFGAIPVVEHNFSFVILGIILISIIPILYEFFISRKS